MIEAHFRFPSISVLKHVQRDDVYRKNKRSTRMITRSFRKVKSQRHIKKSPEGCLQRVELPVLQDKGAQLVSVRYFERSGPLETCIPSFFNDFVTQ